MLNTPIAWADIPGTIKAIVAGVGVVVTATVGYLNLRHDVADKVPRPEFVQHVQQAERDIAETRRMVRILLCRQFPADTECQR
jgi:hypothetical protein